MIFSDRISLNVKCSARLRFARLPNKHLNAVTIAEVKSRLNLLCPVQDMEWSDSEFVRRRQYSSIWRRPCAGSMKFTERDWLVCQVPLSYRSRKTWKMDRSSF